MKVDSSKADIRQRLQEKAERVNRHPDPIVRRTMQRILEIIDRKHVRGER